MGLAGEESWRWKSTFLLGTAVIGVRVSKITHRVRRRGKKHQERGHSRNRGKNKNKPRPQQELGRGGGGREQSLDQDEEGQKTVSNEAKVGQNCNLEGGTEQTCQILFRVEKRKGIKFTSLEA